MKYLHLKYIKLIALLFFSAGLLVTSCEKDEPEIGVSTETVEIHIHNMWEYGDFQLDFPYTHPITGDILNFDTLKYYISNVKLQNADGTWWSHPDSYFLVDVKDTNASVLTLTEVPYGVYTSVSYMVGIDSAKHASPVSTFTGALSLSNKMYVADSGFIMLKAFGLSPNAPAPGAFAYYLRGHKAPDAIMKERIHWFGTVPMTITREGDYRIFVHNSINSIWGSIGSVSATPSILIVGDDAKQVAGDFFTSFAFDSIKE